MHSCARRPSAVDGRLTPLPVPVASAVVPAIVHRERTRYAIFGEALWTTFAIYGGRGRHLPIADAICHLWTLFAICGRHLPISSGCGRHLPILRGGGRHLPFMEGGWTPYAIYGGRGRHLPFWDAICLFRGRLDAICHLSLKFFTCTTRAREASGESARSRRRR